jgi:EAL domain-containing protein (putative c-di-GMP-specific phosphodiesterase class I)
VITEHEDELCVLHIGFSAPGVPSFPTHPTPLCHSHAITSSGDRPLSTLRGGPLNETRPSELEPGGFEPGRNRIGVSERAARLPMCAPELGPSPLLRIPRVAMSSSPTAERPAPARVLLVDDEPGVISGLKLALRKEPFEIECADSGASALALLDGARFDVVVSDERMPGMQGSELLSIVRERHPGVVRIILSGQASFDAALRAINSAAIYRFLIKPCPAAELALTIQEALAARAERDRFDTWRRERDTDEPAAVARELDAWFGSLWMAFQPIVRAKDASLYGFEALLRSDAPGWRGPAEFFAAARKLGRQREAGLRVRDLVAARIGGAPQGALVFVNVNPDDLDDASLVRGTDALAAHAARVVIEVTERESLRSLTDLERTVHDLRKHGYRIAVDDLGAGYAGLSSMLVVAPDLVKFDMDLVRGIDRSPTKQMLVRSIVAMCHGMRIQTLAEGVETAAEQGSVTALGCDLLQGYLLGRPQREFPRATDRPA